MRHTYSNRAYWANYDNEENNEMVDPCFKDEDCDSMTIKDEAYYYEKKRKYYEFQACRSRQCLCGRYAGYNYKNFGHLPYKNFDQHGYEHSHYMGSHMAMGSYKGMEDHFGPPNYMFDSSQHFQYNYPHMSPESAYFGVRQKPPSLFYDPYTNTYWYE